MVVAFENKNGVSMSIFAIHLSTDQLDHKCVEVDNRFHIAIEPIETGLSLSVYPRTDGELCGRAVYDV